MARAAGVDLVEIAPNATPPVCRIIDFGKYRYEQAKRDKESKKHQHANKVKEVQLSPKIDPHDLGVKIEHAIDFLSEDMKVKITLKFRGREMAHTEVGFQVINKFLAEVAPFGHPDFQAKLIGRGINVMISPLPRNKRPKNPRHAEAGAQAASQPRVENNHKDAPAEVERPSKPSGSESNSSNFANNPFAQLEANR
jgi:translation initiation factor IF-3